MLDWGIIRPSESEWISPVHLKKEGEEYRFTLDYRKINQKTKSNSYTVPRIDSLLTRLGDACFVSKVNLKKGYWQIKMHPDSIKYTAFICDEGRYEFVRMPFGLKTAPTVFQRFMNCFIGKARGHFAEAYLDDIIIYSKTWEDHLKHIEFILNQLKNVGFTVTFGKCEFGQTSVTYLGFIISPEGVKEDPK